jgi:hypothetical protein
MVFLVRGLAGNPHREIGHHGGGEIDERMRRLGENCERAGQQADHALGERQPARRRNRGECDLLLDVLHPGLVVPTGSEAGGGRQ